uniref:Uncharacterized protein n=1 Tax=viral metagenome TaxID=1070528 RepID=A0A6C0JVN9_9ZZZZ
MISFYLLFFLIIAGGESLYESENGESSSEEQSTTMSNVLEVEKSCVIEITEIKRVMGTCTKLGNNQPACRNNMWLDLATRQCDD